MGKHATKAGENIFTQARYNAAKFNDRLNSREGASEELGIDRSRLARIELGSKNPFPDEVLMMSDIYNAPELKSYYCKNMCPLGKDFPEIRVGLFIRSRKENQNANHMSGECISREEIAAGVQIRERSPAWNAYYIPEICRRRGNTLL